MAQNGGPEKGGKADPPRPVTLPALYELLQQWQPLEEEDEAGGQPAPTAAPAAAPSGIADTPRNVWRAIARMTREVVDPALSSASEEGVPQRRAEPTAQQVRRATRRRSRVSWDPVSSGRSLRTRRNSATTLVRTVRHLLRLLDLRLRGRPRTRTRTRSHCPALGSLPPLLAPKSSPLPLIETTASRASSSEEAWLLRDRANAEHRAWVRELRRRGRRLMAMPEPEPFWLPHMLGESADADAAAAAALAERRSQERSATLSRPDAAGGYASDLEDSSTSSSNTTSDTTTASTSSGSVRDAAENGRNELSRGSV